jgi:3alpha(or 20beta)-hydroxysteroid dehydrogenase
VDTRLDGRVAIISGAAGGLGTAFTRALHAAGASVVIADLADDAAAALATELGDRALATRLDVTSQESWAATVDAALGGFGALDVLVNNAGIANAGPIDHYPLAKWDAVIAVNLTGVFLGVQAVVPAMKAAGRGSIINISSVEGMRGGDHLHGYVASKFGVRGLTKSLAVELGRDGIRVNSVHPGFVLTPMTARLDPTATAIPLGRPAEASDVAGTVVFLASDESAYTTGTELVVDGGMIAGIPHS